MKTHNELPGTPGWHQRRGTCFNASDAAAMLGCSPHETRNQLLARLHSGIHKEFSDYAQERVIDPGHEYEAKARPLAEEIIGDELAPVGGSLDVGLSRPLGASFDGLTMLGDVVWEHKRLNAQLAAMPIYGMEGVAIRAADLAAHYRAQLEQQLLVSGAGRALFMATKWNGEHLEDQRHCWYESDPALRAEILAGWKQFDADLAAYVPPEASAPAATPAPIEALPAVSVRMDGALAVHSNLDVFGAKLREFIARIPSKPTTDQEFADCDAACKALKKAEDALDGAEANALGQVQTVETLTRTIADLRSAARTARLASEKMVKARKEQIRVEEVQRGQKALAEFIAGLNSTIGKPYLPTIAADFGAAISGKKTLESLKAAVDQHLADKKIEANAIAGYITVNLRTLKAHGDYEFLFADIRQIVTKAPEDFQALAQSRVLAHQAEEQRRAEAAAEKERERIRQEEADKLRREQEAAQRAQAPAPAPTPAPAPIAAPALSTKPAAANSPTVVPITRGTPTLRVGEIANRLGFGIGEAFLRQLGFAPAGKQGASCLYHEADFDLICEALIAHVRTVQAKQHEAVAA